MAKKFKSGHGMKPATYTAIQAELENARAAFQDTTNLLIFLESRIADFRIALQKYQDGQSNISAMDVYFVGVVVAVLAIRLIEEGCKEFPRYYEYRVDAEFQYLTDMLGPLKASTKIEK